VDNAQWHPGFERAVRHFGSQAALARAVGITPQSVNQYKRVGFSAETALRIERLTEGRLRALDLVRPDAIETAATA